ncbi:diguanylate cyclase [Chitinibacter sp. S2-10]|uniref:sensor domain-containing diguanylate cyclase n=1 Tax=Chitinibacter sp. S2-10 TaxID=3373597 RepID=UPI003977509A
MPLPRQIEHALKQLSFKRILLLVFLLLQAASAAIYLQIERKQIEESTATIIQNTTALHVKNIQLLGHLIRRQLLAIGESHFLAQTMNTESLMHELQAEWLDAVFILDSSGALLREGSLFPLEQLLDPEVIQSRSFAKAPFLRLFQTKGNAASVIFIQRPGHEQIGNGGMMFSHAIINKHNGQLLGYVVGFFSNRTLDNILVSNARRSGVTLGSLGALVIYDTANNKLLYSSLASTLKPGDPFLPRQLTDSPYSTTIKHYISPQDNRERLGAFAPINNGWSLVIGMASDEYLSSWHIQVAVSVAVLLFMATLQWMLVNFIHRFQMQRDQLEYDALHDPLTGLANRRSFDFWANTAVSRSKRYMQPLTLLALDLDHFKRVNDTYGHDAGDAVLTRVAETLRTVLRECDLPARFGGEEFIVALPQTPLPEAALVAERIRAAIQELVIYTSGQTLQCTVSIGVALVNGQAIEAALKEADAALYQAKEAGRNCVIALRADADKNDEIPREK